jgi:hypothetical protein
MGMRPGAFVWLQLSGRGQVDSFPQAPVKAERGRDGSMHDAPIVDVEARGKMRVMIERGQAFVGELDYERQRCVV